MSAVRRDWERPGYDTLPPQLRAADLAIEIADECARTDIECKARHVPSNYPCPVYDVSALESSGLDDPDLTQASRDDVARAVRYLDLRGMLVRPIVGQPQYVSFGGAA